MTQKISLLFVLLLLLIRNEAKITENEKLYMNKKGLLLPPYYQRRSGKSGRRRPYYFFMGKNKEVKIDSKNMKKYVLTNIHNLENEKWCNFTEQLRNVKNRIFNFFKRDKNVIDRLRDLNEKESLWFVTGYAKNMFTDNSFYHIIGFEHIKEMDFNKIDLVNTMPALENLLSTCGKKGNLQNGDYMIGASYRVRKHVVFYKNNNFCFNEVSKYYQTTPTSGATFTRDTPSTNTADENNKKRIHHMNKNYILCSYTYYLLYIYSKKDLKFYICTYDMNNECSVYEMKTLDKEDLHHFLNNYISGKKDLKNINVFSLIKKNKVKRHAPEDISCSELLNVINYTNKFSSYLKRLFNLCHNSDMLLENRISPKCEQGNITFIFGNTNFLLKNKTYLECVKDFFFKNDQEKNMFDHIFKNNKGYKFYVQKGVTDKSSYVLRCTKITKKKLEMLHKKLLTNYEHKNFNEKKGDSFFDYTKILFDKCANYLSSNAKKNIFNEENYTHRSVCINISSNNRFGDAENISSDIPDETLLFTLTKNFLNSLISYLHV
ncbi:hypothetical protein, conserved [Plasmodium gonderi]|uniref:Uncharacterized protein n=1 Tax=Plasmodium gonderi TaxID=77519 RepID=A0A1Y1JFY9_PLAGO|nr:hypothetical protein, conserved [Plasmodium gonderi]GAW80127.1 hypothetical protein, conserved [Plasmodium gonderi]